MKVAIIGGGAAGFFSAISVKTHHPNYEVHLFERSAKVLSKVRISGGGRCNVTHDCTAVRDLIKNYPRGAKFLRNALHQFGVAETINWYESHGVPLKVEGDGRMFPKSDRSASVIQALTEASNTLGVELHLSHPVDGMMESNSAWQLESRGSCMHFDKVIVATGGSPKKSGLEWLNRLGVVTVDPVPSLFSFNIADEELCQLPGLSMPRSRVWLEATKLESIGPLLITHWGMSGPAVLKLSAMGARELSGLAYQTRLRVQWSADHADETVRGLLQNLDGNKRMIKNEPLFPMPERLWYYLIQKAGINLEQRWSELSKKEKNRLVEVLTNDVYSTTGKTTNKDEFVTAGGVSLHEVDPNTMAHKRFKSLYFTGEVLDVDGFTGGFNFQAAWSTAWLAGQLK